MKKVSIAYVEKLANVSNSTVSQYINQRFSYMINYTKNHIKMVIEELNYIPNYIARSLKKNKTSTIDVLVANILYPFSTKIIKAIEDYCHLNQYHAIVCNADDNPKKKKLY